MALGYDLSIVSITIICASYLQSAYRCRESLKYYGGFLCVLLKQTEVASLLCLCE